MRQDDFKPNIVRKVAERAGYLCSNPSCPRITIGPDLTDSNKSTIGGVAAHICAASVLGPRYDMSQTSLERQSITNAIWLCGTCSMIIDKNNGHDYPASTLRKWKKDHELVIKECLEGNKRMIISFIDDTDQSKVCKRIIKFLQQRGALYVDLQYEIPRFVIESVKEIRVFLTSIQAEIESGTQLEIIVDSINTACRNFMNFSNPSITDQEILYNLSVMRKMVGINLANMSKTYKVQIPNELKILLPVI